MLLRLPLIAATTVSLALVSVPPAAHADPANEDEWYDPTDWFDGNNKESDDTYNYGSYGAGADYYSGGTYPYEDGFYDYTDYDYGDGYNDAGYRDYGTSNSYWRDSYDYDANTTNQNRSQQARQTQDQQNQQRTLAGTIEGFREVNVRDRKGAQDRFTVVRLRLRDGRSATVDLGKRLSLRDVNLEKGDYVSVSGRQRMISGQNVILAETIYADGQLRRITRGGQASSGGQQQTAQKQQSRGGGQPLQGTVESFRRVNVEGANETHTLVRLTLENGKPVIVDLGPDETPRSVRMNVGDYVRIRGSWAELNSKPIMRAQSVSVNGSWQDVRQTSLRSGSQQ